MNIPVAAFTEACGETAAELNYTTGACIPQTGTTQKLDSYGDRLMYRLAYRNFGSYQALVANHTVTLGTSSSQTGIRWYELQNTGTGFGLHQQGTYAPDSSYRWMGSIAMDQAGDIALGYSVSSATMSPSIRYTGRVATDPLGTMESEVDILAQAGITTSSRTNTYRWGDYSAMAIDPSDDCTFWYTTQYETGGTSNWSTRIASFNFPSCTQSTALTVNEVGHGTVTSTDGEINCTNDSGTCSAVYTTGSSVTLNATAASGWTFSGWSGSCSGANPCQVVMSSSLSVTATFKANTAWAIVHEASKGGVTSLTIPATGSGHLIAVALMFNGNTSVASLSDNATGGSNTYVSAGARSTSGIWSTEIWYAVSSKPGATVVTPTLAGSAPQVQMAVWEVSGLSASTPDATNTSSGNLTLNNTPGPAVTTKQAGDFIVSIMLANTSNLSAITSGNAFTDDFGTNGNGWAHITSTSAAVGTYQASWYAASPSGQYCASTVAFHQ
jgi:Divergent InlB B-repeat domain